QETAYEIFTLLEFRRVLFRSIDAIRNPLELVYLRDQIAALYAVAITADDKDRKERLSIKGVSRSDIEAIDKKEYSKKAIRSYSEIGRASCRERAESGEAAGAV